LIDRTPGATPGQAGRSLAVADLRRCTNVKAPS